MPDFEAAHPLKLRIINDNVLDARVRRSTPHPVDHSRHGTLVALEMSFDGSVRPIADPAADPELTCLALRPHAKEHSLDPTGDLQTPGDLRHGALATWV
jgi:hypothetical protein